MASLCREDGYLDFSKGAILPYANSKNHFSLSLLLSEVMYVSPFPLVHCPSPALSFGSVAWLQCEESVDLSGIWLTRSETLRSSESVCKY